MLFIMDEIDYQPVIIKRGEDLKVLIDSNSAIKVVDAFSRQLKELFFIDNTKYIGSDKEETYKTEDFLRYVEDKKEQFQYFYYPWNSHVVKCINENDYFRLKTNRNQDLITAQEQIKLYNYKVAVFGMSVGSNIAFVLTQSGISRKIIIADFDDLDTTNLNRILAGVHQVGTNKTIVAARRIYEDNPYAEVSILPDGISEKQLEDLLKNKEINCIIEEIDDINMKLQTRILAIKYKVPVIMITDNGDDVVLHVERYDLGYDKIFDKNIEFWQEKLKASTKFTKAEAGQIIIGDIVGGPEKVDPKMMASVKRVLNKELVSWSQLGSAAILGGVAATVAIKRIALGESSDLNIREYIGIPKIK